MPIGNHSIQPASGFYGSSWPASGAIPQSYSFGGWTTNSQGFEQQTFLGASIRSFNMQGGFGDTSSTLSIELVNDEYNKSDGTALGLGDDPYHSGTNDRFAPPPVGSPVFFKFGKKKATVEEAYRQTFDDLYGVKTMGDITFVPVAGGGNVTPSSITTLATGQLYDPVSQGIGTETYTYASKSAKGKYHLTFGGILQSYTQNRGPGGNPLYSVQVVDPREILSNVVLILNNYAGTVYDNKNIINVYGFLEHNPTTTTTGLFSSHTKSVVTKTMNAYGAIAMSGNDCYVKPNAAPVTTVNTVPNVFPITGTGFSRRGQHGIPFYRVRDAVSALMRMNGTLPDEYIAQGFGGFINFRGFNYVIDFSGLPNLPNFYYLDFDQINLLELALEICDVLNRDLFVSLLPVIDHPACEYLYKYNDDATTAVKDVVAGIIRIDTIDRSKEPKYGSIKKYIDQLASGNIYVENQDVGYELSNVTTDKFVTGAQEVDIYYFSDNADRDTLDVRKIKNAGTADNITTGYQWTLDSSLEQQILPYYGLLGNRAITIPKGFGSYQQILLDSTGLNAKGVGNYYVATEMELRCALISFERWKQFLLQYNDIYLESVEANDAKEGTALQSTPATGVVPHLNGLNNKVYISNNYAVSVPRSVFDTDIPQTSGAIWAYGTDKLPISACNPPYGYPLYYKRATKIGIPEAGLTRIQAKLTSIITSIAKLKATDKSNFAATFNTEWQTLKETILSDTGVTSFEKDYFALIESKINAGNQNIDDIVGLIENNTQITKAIKILPKLAKKSNDNAMKVYNFIKNIAEECLGKKFLVKIPKKVNLFYSDKVDVNGLTITSINQNISSNSIEYIKGPFGFKPRPISEVDPTYISSSDFSSKISTDATSLSMNMMKSFLSSGTTNQNTILGKYKGALSVNFNPVLDDYEFNYTPCEQGGFFNHSQYPNIITVNQITNYPNFSFSTCMPSSIICSLSPTDISNFVNENGRISPYVRFDNSQHLSFESIGSESFTQEIATAYGLIPDLTEECENLRDTFTSFPNANQNPEDINQQKQITFVKCNLSEKLYMPPKTEIRSTYVHGRGVKNIDRFVKPRKIYDENSDSYVDSVGYYEAQYVPDYYNLNIVNKNVRHFKYTYNSILNGNIINTNMEDLDTDHVYALITLPGRVIPTKDARFRDGPIHDLNAEQVKHLLSADVVKGVDGFEVPAFIKSPTKIYEDLVSSGNLSITSQSNALNIAKKARENLCFAFPQRINATMPSPVYPNLVSLSLMSKERCYGPWVSSQINPSGTRYKNIGGKVEFIKDENLAPWNYAGYYMMNQAGMLQAEYSQSLMLATERGGFVVPDAPSGVSLARALLNGGPLITSISVDVSDRGVHTTYKMDLYTVSFGKLQKQKANEISKISREKQKARDERNALIRKGFGKNQSNFNYQLLLDNMNNMKIDNFNNFNAPNASTLIAQAIPYTDSAYSPQLTASISQNGVNNAMSIVNPESISNVASNFVDRLSLSQAHGNTAASEMKDLYTPISKEPLHPNMASIPDPFVKSKQNLYPVDSKYNNDDLTTYEA